MVRVLGFGDNVVDKYEHIKTMYPGGNCVNFAVYAKQNGVESSAYMGIFGTDSEAEHVIHTLGELNIETFKCRQIPGENGCAKVTLENGNRVFIGSNKGGVRKTNPFILDRFDLEYIKTFDLVHTGNNSYTESELSKIRQAGVEVSFDFSHGSTDDYFKKVAPDVDYAFLSCSDQTEEEIRVILKKISDYGCKIVVATMGPRGCMAFNGSRYFFEPAVDAEVIDTMGAGDSLATSFMVHYVRGKKQGTDQNTLIPHCLVEGSKFAIKTCMVPGAFDHGARYE
ncbi:MAG TPA: PfkB family carbohydrate kinase [Clostridia bacterium]|nr:PfkB family carbohydrate kinase [Clostridia bacterium]